MPVLYTFQCIEYENAFYHVMNRARERQYIFHGKEYYHSFLETLAKKGIDLFNS